MVAVDSVQKKHRAILTLSLLTGVQNSNQLLINICDKINLIFFLNKEGKLKESAYSFLLCSDKIKN